MYTGKDKYPNNLIPVIIPAYTASEDRTECSETSAHKIQTPWNRPKDRIQHSEQGENLKSRSVLILFFVLILSSLSKLIRLLVPVTLMPYYTTATKHDG